MSGHTPTIHTDASSNLRAVSELTQRLSDPNILNRSEGLQFSTDLKALSQSLDFDALREHGDSISLLFQNAADACPPTLASHMFAALELAVERYSQCVTEDELTSMHAALATLSAQHHLFSPYLQLFTEVSNSFVPMNGPGEFFSNCSVVYARRKEWEPASMHAALALVQDPDATKWRTWVLYELIAFGESRELPRTVQPVDKCPLVSELATYFVSYNRTTGKALRRFCAEHEPKFKKLGVWHLVQRAIISFYLKWLRTMSPSLDVVSWDSLEPALSPMSLNELLAAGLERDFIITESSNGTIYLEPRKHPRDEEKALRLLNETSMLAGKVSEKQTQQKAQRRAQGQRQLFQAY